MSSLRPSSPSSGAPAGAGPESLLDLAVALAERPDARFPADEVTEAARALAPRTTEIAPARARAALQAVIMGR